MSRSYHDGDGGQVAAIEGPVAEGSGISDLLSILQRRKTTAAITFLICTALVTLYALSSPAIYSADSVVMVETLEDDEQGFAAAAKVSAADELRISTTIEIMKSRRLAEKLASELVNEIGGEGQVGGAYAHATAKRALSWLKSFGAQKAAASDVEGLDENEALLKLAKNKVVTEIDIKRLSRSRLIEISAIAPSPQEAAKKANAMVEVYLISQRKERNQSQKKKIENLTKLVEEAQLNLYDADLAVAKYMRENNLIARGEAAVQSRIARLESSLTEAKSVSRSRRLNQLLDEQQSLKERLGQLSVIYGSGYPEIVDLRAKLAAKDFEIISEREKTQREARSRQAQLDASAAALSSELASVRRTHFKAMEANAGLNELERKASQQLDSFNRLTGRLQRAMNALYEDRDEIKIISKAIVPATPSNTTTSGVIAVGSIGSAMLALLFAFAAEAFDTSIRSGAHVRNLIGAPTLAMVPRAPGRRIQPDLIRDYLAEHPDTEFTESLRNLYLELVSNGVAHSPQLIVVTSVLPDEGKTTIANGLAAMASFFDQRAIAVSLDPHATNDSGGEAELVQADHESGGAEIERASLYPVNGPRAVSLRELPQQLDELRERWDMIIVDAPPILKSRDAKALASYADGMVLVMEWSKTPAGAARAAREILDGIDVGVVLNRVNLKTHARRGYGDAVQYSQHMKDRNFW